MARRYTITVTIEADFERAINARRARKQAEKALKMPGWQVRGSTVRNKKLKGVDFFEMLSLLAGKEHDRLVRQYDRQEEKAAAHAERDQKTEALARVRAIYREIKGAKVRAPSAVFKWRSVTHPEHRDYRPQLAHAHYERGARAGYYGAGYLLASGGHVKGNLVCLNDQYWSYYYTESDEEVARTVAHELAHIGGHSHRMNSFKQRKARFMAGWRAARGMAPATQPQVEEPGDEEEVE